MITNRIVSGILSEFVSDFEIEKIPTEKAFEYFITYLIVSRIHPEAFEEPDLIRELDVDKGSNFGIDSFCMIINDNLVLKPEDIEAFRKSKRLEVRFIFIQAKTSSKVDSGDILKFTSAVHNIFSASPLIPLTEDMKYCKSIIEEVYKHENVRYLTKDSPRCELYYATTSRPITDDTIHGILKSEEESIKRNIVDIKNVTVKLIDSEYIIDAYNEIENRFDVVINFKNSISFERIDGVNQGYIGYLSACQFIKLISDKDGNLRKNLFYENVRDFQGTENPINVEIAETVSDQSLHDKFVILNNGVTIVTKQLVSLGSNDYEVRDFYIANGCQTSTIIHKHRNSLMGCDRFYVPVKIIHTTSSDLITSIIKATNRQTPVPDEAFLALEKFHKRLQDFYLQISAVAKDKLFYERRHREFANSDNPIERSKIVNLHSQVRSFVSIIMGDPQLVYSRNPASIIKEHGTKIFNDGDSYHPYFLSSYILYKFYQLSNRGLINAKYTLFRFYIGWILRVLNTGSVTMNTGASKRTQEICECLIRDLDDSTKCETMFCGAIETLEKGMIRHRTQYGSLSTPELVRRKNFRDIFAVK